MGNAKKDVSEQGKKARGGAGGESLFFLVYTPLSDLSEGPKQATRSVP